MATTLIDHLSHFRDLANARDSCYRMRRHAELGPALKAPDQTLPAGGLMTAQGKQDRAQ